MSADHDVPAHTNHECLNHLVGFFEDTLNMRHAVRLPAWIVHTRLPNELEARDLIFLCSHTYIDEAWYALANQITFVVVQIFS